MLFNRLALVAATRLVVTRPATTAPQLHVPLHDASELASAGSDVACGDGLFDSNSSLILNVTADAIAERCVEMYAFGNDTTVPCDNATCAFRVPLLHRDPLAPTLPPLPLFNSTLSVSDGLPVWVPIVATLGACVLLAALAGGVFLLRRRAADSSGGRTDTRLSTSLQSPTVAASSLPQYDVAPAQADEEHYEAFPGTTLNEYGRVNLENYDSARPDAAMEYAVLDSGGTTPPTEYGVFGGETVVGAPPAIGEQSVVPPVC